MPRTGGIQKGYKYPKSIEKEFARELVRNTITAALGPMLRAQIAHAQGIGHMYTRDKNGKYTKVENPDRVDQLLREGTEGLSYFIFTKDPSSAAFKELLDRALDRPKEQAQEIHVSGEIELSSRLTSARARVIELQIDPTKPGEKRHALPPAQSGGVVGDKK